MSPVLDNVQVEVGDHFGHIHIIVRAPGKGSINVSLADPDGATQLSRELVRLAVEQGYDGEEPA